MKTYTLLSILLFMAPLAYSQGLNSAASYIRSNYEKEYEVTIRKHALDKWETDYTMVVYEINRQSDAIIELIEKFESKYTNIAFNAIRKWSFRGYENINIRQWEKIDTFGLKQLISMHCDWTMVLYEYNNQVKARESF